MPTKKSPPVKKRLAITKKSYSKPKNQFGKLSLITTATSEGFRTCGEIEGDKELLAESLAEIARRRDDIKMILYKAFTAFFGKTKYKVKKPTKKVVNKKK